LGSQQRHAAQQQQMQYQQISHPHISSSCHHSYKRCYSRTCRNYHFKAALEFDQAAVEIRGAKAKLNFPEKFAQGEGGVGSEPAAPEAGGRMEMQGREWGRRGKRGQC
ncbi:hypothetical protein CLOP_g18251, partial [Closterium sp. NIES-67]